MADQEPGRREDDAWPEGTYLVWRSRLYEAVAWDEREIDGSVQRALRVVNCLTDHDLWLSLADLKEALAIRTTPDSPPADWKAVA